MASKKTISCPSCGFPNKAPLTSKYCVSCGANMDVERRLVRQDERYHQSGFVFTWFVLALLVQVVLTAAIVIGLPMVLPVLDFEGSSGMLISIPVWFTGGILVGLVSPGRTFTEPVAATFLVSIPTALFLYHGQTVKTMPAFMYVLMSSLGVLFTLIGAFVGERIQMGPPPKPIE